jgi:hypothetical protein
MNRYYLAIFFVSLLTPQCTKDTGNDGVVAMIKEDYLVCADEGWIDGLQLPTQASNVCFTYNNKVYIPQLFSGTLEGDNKVYIYDGTNWTTRNSTIPLHTYNPVVFFTIGSKGYVAKWPGSDGQSAFYEYNLLTNTWTRKADFPGKAYAGAGCFTINGKGYVAGGQGYDGYTSETWEYNPANNSWRERKNLLFKRSSVTGFSIGNKGYILHGRFPNDLGYFAELTEYDPATNNWTNKADYPGPPRGNSNAFVIDGIAYAGGGTANFEYFTDFYKYNPATDNWMQLQDMPVLSYKRETFVLSGKGYINYGNFGPAGTGPGLFAKYFPRRCVEMGASIPNVNQ